MTFKEMADEFMLKWKIVSEKKDELTNSYHALQEEGIVPRERLWAEWTKEVEEAIGQLTKNYEQTIQLVTAKAKNNHASWEVLSAKEKVFKPRSAYLEGRHPDYRRGHSPNPENSVSFWP